MRAETLGHLPPSFTSPLVFRGKAAAATFSQAVKTQKTKMQGHLELFDASIPEEALRVLCLGHIERERTSALGPTIGLR